MSRTWDVTSSVLASTIRQWRGTKSSRHTQPPEQLLVLFEREGCPRCRLVREALTELNLDVLVYPVPLKGRRHLDKLRELSGGEAIPFLHDPNTEARQGGAGAILHYLYRTYGQGEVPKELEENKANLSRSTWASRMRGDRGTYSQPGKAADQPVELHSFESSPYTRLVRERLSELEIPYIVRQLGKQQRADVGPATFRMHLGRYKPLPGSRREAILKQRGRVQVPFLIDPNTQVEMYESADILEYLERTYAA